MAKDNWETPWDFIDNVSREFPLVLDVCTDGSNAKCSSFITDSLNKDWHSIVQSNGGGFVWCNPPYSDPSPWVNKIITTVHQGTGSLLLVNAMTSADWFHKALTHCSELWVFKGRIAFVDPDTGLPAGGNDRSQVMFIFDPHRIGECKTRSVKVSEYQKIKRQAYRSYCYVHNR